MTSAQFVTAVSSGAASGSHSALKPRAGSFATMAPAFFLIGAGAVAMPSHLPNDDKYDATLFRYESDLSSMTRAVYQTLQQPSVEERVIARLDAIFEELLASQRDLAIEDQKAIAKRLWQLYE